MPFKPPLANNIFSSVELKDFEHVSDGQKSLVVSPIQQVLVTPGTYSFSTNYMSGTTDLRNYLRYYPTWDTATDNYLGALTGTPDGFTVEVKAIPPDAVLDYSVEVVALRYSGTPATPVDGISGATTPILRQVRLTLRPRSSLTRFYIQKKQVQITAPWSLMYLKPYPLLWCLSMS